MHTTVTVSVTTDDGDVLAISTARGQGKSLDAFLETIRGYIIMLTTMGGARP